MKLVGCCCQHVTADDTVYYIKLLVHMYRLRYQKPTQWLWLLARTGHNWRQEAVPVHHGKVKWIWKNVGDESWKWLCVLTLAAWKPAIARCSSILCDIIFVIDCLWNAQKYLFCFTFFPFLLENRMGVSGWMFLLVGTRRNVHPAVKWLLLLLYNLLNVHSTK